MKNRCPSAKLLGKAKLEGYKFFITKRGVASIRKGEDFTVWGVLFEIGKECEESLDRYEGFPTSYRKKNIKVATDNRKDIEAFAYIANEEEEGTFGNKYLEIILEGAKENKLPKSYINFLKKLND
jgi:gamma-glutamylcyclotransferase (GGCT)/AIG2-like uncharacterized protein YtfP